MSNKNVYEAVVCPPGREGEVIPTMRLGSVKHNGRNKSRFVVQGNKTKGRGVHFTEIATSMASQTAVKMVVALAAGCCYELFSIDFEQAFLNSEVGVPGILIELPDFPAELKNTGIGHHKGELAPCGGRLAGRLNKALFFRARFVSLLAIGFLVIITQN